MKQKNSQVFLLFVFLFMAVSSKAQEIAPVKTFNYEISITKLKTQEQADAIQDGVSSIEGVIKSRLVLTEYNLIFSCTNHDMSKYQIMNKVKSVVVSKGAEIVTIKRTLQDD